MSEEARNSGQPATTVVDWVNETVAAEPISGLGPYMTYVQPVVKSPNPNIEKKIKRRGWSKQFFEK